MNPEIIVNYTTPQYLKIVLIKGRNKYQTLLKKCPHNF